jgi:hypothetical protein
MAGGQIIDRLLGHYADVTEIADEAELLIHREATLTVEIMYEVDPAKLKKLKADLVQTRANIKVNRIRASANKKLASILQTASRTPM